jgi:hypothetical protein
MKKYIVFIENGGGPLKNEVILAHIALNGKTNEFSRSDIINLFEQFGINSTPFDLIYVDANAHDFISSADYDISFVFCEKANIIFLTIVCKSKNAKQRMLKQLDKFSKIESEDDA